MFAISLLFASILPIVGCEGEPELVSEHLRFGDEALATGDHSRALAAYGHAHEIAPTSARVQRAQMWARVHLMADSPSRVATESLEDIAYEAQLALALYKADASKQAVCHTAQANVFARKGDIEAAKAQLAEAIKLDATCSVAHAALGLLLTAEHDKLAAAKAEFRLALQHNTNSATALFGLGQLALAEGDLAGATSSFETALQKRDDLITRTALGKTLLQQNKYGEAVRQLERVTLIEPRNAEAWSGLGQALLGMARLEEAERALRTAMALRADEPTATALGFALRRMKRPEQALAVFNQVLSQNGASAAALYGAGGASEEMGRPDDAFTYYRRLLALAAEGAQKSLVSELQKEAQTRVEALRAGAEPTQAPTGSAAASAAPSALSNSPSNPPAPPSNVPLSPPPKQPKRGITATDVW